MPWIQAVPNNFGESLPASTDKDFHIGVSFGEPIHIWHILGLYDLRVEQPSRHLQLTFSLSDSTL